jgi:Ser/Thr protein kinase RdoA (MazF antagonist)
MPAPTSLAIDPHGEFTHVAAHLMSYLPGAPRTEFGVQALRTMALMLAAIHHVRPTEPFRTYQSWAWKAKRVVPPWTEAPDAWTAAFQLLAREPPRYEPVFLHRDYGHRNLLWSGDQITGVVDWVETSTGPAWLDAGHAATNLAVAFSVQCAQDFLSEYEQVATTPVDPYWLLMDAVGFLPPPGKKPLFDSAAELQGLDAWLVELITTWKLG